MFNQVLTKELKAFVVLAKEYNVVLLSLLESLDGLGSNSLHLLLHSLELLIFLQCELPLCFEVVPQSLGLFLDGVGLSHNNN